MKRVEFKIEDDEFEATQAAAEGLGMTLSEFVRIALAEKREWANPIIELRALHEDVQGLGPALREQLAQSHAALMAEHRQGLAEARAEVAESLRKNEAATRLFLENLVEAIAPQTPRSSRREPADTDWSPGKISY